MFMAVTILFNGLKIYSRFRLWRIDATREKLATDIKQLELTAAEKQSAAQSIMSGLDFAGLG